MVRPSVSNTRSAREVVPSPRPRNGVWSPFVATLRQRRRGVREVRVFTGNDGSGRPTQLSRTVHGGKREAQRVAAEMEAADRPAARVAPRGIEAPGDAIWVGRGLVSRG